MKEKVVVTPVAEGAAVNNEPAIDVDGYMEGSDGIEVFASQCLPAKLDKQLPEQVLSPTAVALLAAERVLSELREELVATSGSGRQLVEKRIRDFEVCVARLRSEAAAS